MARDEGAPVSLASQRCVVLGAGGFIGVNLCNALRGQVAELRAFARRGHPTPHDSDIDWRFGDFEESSSLAAAVEGCDTVFHLVTTTTPSTSNVDKAADIRSNIIGSVNLLEVCRDRGVKRVVFVSSGGTVYGMPHGRPSKETDPTFPTSSYGVGKLTIERYLYLFEHLYGLEHRILRVSNPYGPHQTASKNQGVVAAFLRRAVRGEPIEVWGDGSVSRDYIYIADVVSALISAATHQGSERIFNVGSGRSRTLREVIATIDEVTGRSLDVVYRPGRSIDVPVSTLDIHLAGQALGWRPTVPFDVGIERTYNWMRDLLSE